METIAEIAKRVLPSPPPPGSTTISDPSSLAEDCALCSGDGYVMRDAKMHLCACAIERRIAARLPKRYHLAKLADFSAQTVKIIQVWLDHPGEGLLIMGPPGTGKTYLAAAIIRHTIETGRKSLLFERCAEFYLRIRDCYHEATGSEAAELSRLEAPGLVILDDLAAGSLSDFERRCTLEVIDRRLNCARPTVVTTNWTLAKIDELMDGRIGSRLAQFQMFTMSGPDRRVPASAKNPGTGAVASR